MTPPLSIALRELATPIFSATGMPQKRMDIASQSMFCHEARWIRLVAQVL